MLKLSVMAYFIVAFVAFRAKVRGNPKIVFVETRIRVLEG